MAATNLPRVYNENYGNVTRPQLAAYRKYNVSQTDHDILVDSLGDDPRRIVACIKDLAAGNNGFYNPHYHDILDWGRDH